jgi:hypothetical protein
VPADGRRLPGRYAQVGQPLQRGQRLLGLRAADRDPLPTGADLDRAQEQELHTDSEHRTPTAAADRDRNDGRS